MNPGAHVLVTRPAGQADALMAALAARGWRVTHRPAIAIEPLPLDDAARRTLLELDRYYAVMFVSVNAVSHAVAALADYWPQWPVGIHWLAVGDATADALRREGLTPVSPDHGFNSEALLTLPCLQQMTDRAVLIFSGDTGRTLLRDTLRARGARVDVLPLYRRVCAAFAWPAEVDVVMVTSVESWQCIAAQVPREVPVIAGSDRIADVIRADGREVVAAASPHDADMIAALEGMREASGTGPGPCARE